MTRTAIELDDDLLDRAMRRYRFESADAAVRFALERLVDGPTTRDEILALEGSGFDLTNDEVEGDTGPEGPNPPR
jgi:Arc/MetJ family transcription regulator